MAEKPTSPAAGARTELGNDISLTAEPSPNSPENQAKQAVITSLKRDYEAEAARLQAIQSARAASTMFSHLGDYLALHMLADADRSLESARQFGREVTQNLKRLHTTIDAEAAAIFSREYSAGEADDEEAVR